MAEAAYAWTGAAAADWTGAAEQADSQQATAMSADAPAWPVGNSGSGPPVDPAAFASFMNAAAAGQFPNMPPFPGYGSGSAPGTWPQPQAGWPQMGPGSADQPPVAQPPSHLPTQPTAVLPGPTSSGQAPPGGAAGFNASRQQAAMALWAHQWATAAMQQQYGGWPPQAGGPPQWPDQGWPDQSSWPAGPPSTGSAAEPWAHYAQAAAAAGQPGSTGESAPSGAALEAASHSLELLEKMQGDYGKLEVVGAAELEDVAEEGAEEGAVELDEEGKSLREDITSAVAQFLSGDYDPFCESDSEPESDDGQADKVVSPAASAPAPLPVPAQNYLQPPVKAPPPPSSMAPPPPPRSPPGPPPHLASAALAAAGLMTPAPSTNPRPNVCLAEHIAGPTPEGVQDFLTVLRRRALPAELTEDKLKHSSNVIQNCVLSLYRDRIRPVQNNVQRRLRERGTSDVLVQALLPICARESETYRILPPSGSRLPVILLLQEPKWFDGFVDTEAPENGSSNYSNECWEALVAFLSDDDVTLPSQPYQAAIELRLLSLPHLQSLALGEIEHMVRLSMGKRKLLGFLGDSLRPLRVVRQFNSTRDRIQQRSKAVDMEGAKASTAVVSNKTEGQHQHSDTPPANAAGDITDKDDLTVVLLQLMARFPDGVSLSLMKQHVQSICKRNLSEANFKCSKLAEVFKLEPLNSIFPLKQIPQRNEIIVKPPNKSAIPNHIWQKYYNLKEHGGLPPQTSVPGPLPAAYVASGSDAAVNAAVQAEGLQ